MVCIVPMGGPGLELVKDALCRGEQWPNVDPEGGGMCL
jgi:hypothetical protein